MDYPETKTKQTIDIANEHRSIFSKYRKISEENRKKEHTNQQSIVIYPASVGWGNKQEEDHLLSILTFLKNRTDALFFIISDSLQKYNLLTKSNNKISEEEAYEQAYNNGSKYLEQNGIIFNILEDQEIEKYFGMKFEYTKPIPYQIYRWDYFLGKEHQEYNAKELADNKLKFLESYNKVVDCFNNEESFRSAINEDYQRISQSEYFLNCDEEIKKTNSIHYLLEETAVYRYISKLLKEKAIEIFNFNNPKLIRVYPGSPLEAIQWMENYEQDEENYAFARYKYRENKGKIITLTMETLAKYYEKKQSIEK